MSLLKYYGAKLVNVIITKLAMSSSALDVVVSERKYYINPFSFQRLLNKSNMPSQSVDNKIYANGQSRETHYAKT